MFHLHSWQVFIKYSYTATVHIISFEYPLINLQHVLIGVVHYVISTDWYMIEVC